MIEQLELFCERRARGERVAVVQNCWGPVFHLVWLPSHYSFDWENVCPDFETVDQAVAYARERGVVAEYRDEDQW